MFVSVLMQIFYSAAVSAQIEVNGLRVWNAPDHTRLVFDTNNKASYQDYLESNPLRLVVNIDQGKHLVQMPDLSANPRIKSVMHGVDKSAGKAGVYRYVFELKRPTKINSFQLKPNQLYGHRVVLDLYDAKDDPKTTKSLDSMEVGNKTIKPLPKVNSEQDLIAQLESELATLKQGQDNQSKQTKLIKPVIKKEISQPRSNQLIVAIDAGHGGEDPGAVGWRRLKEKNITLKIAKKLNRLVNSDPSMKGHLVREGDYFIRLHNRTKIARKKRADLFVSIHADAFTKKSANGLSVFALSQSGASSAMARTLAKKENAADLIGGVSLKDKDDLLAHVLLDLSMSNTINEGVEFGKEVLSRLKGVGRLHSKRVEQAGFAVLKSHDIPSILVETGFITNPDEAKRLNTNSYQDKLAKAIYNGIRSYYQKNPIYKGQTTILVEEESRSSLPVNVSRETSAASESVKANPVAVSVERKYHKVKSGQALSVIAKRNGVSVKDIKRWNKLKSSKIFIGQKLKLFDPSLKVSPEMNTSQQRQWLEYKVKSGDSLSVLAKRYKVRQSEIKSLNKLRSSNLRIGQKLKLPANNVTSKAVIQVVQKVKPKAKPDYYVVRSGDSLSSISKNFNIKLSTLKKRNGLSSNRLKIGQRLRVSLQAGKSSTVKSSPVVKKKRARYRVKRGDTLSEIAERYGLTMAQLRRLNGIKGNQVYIGQKLKVSN